VSSHVTNWPYPGKILIVDNDYDDYIRDATEQLHQSGASVAYWDGTSRKSLVNDRVVLLDIDFSGQGGDPEERAFYYDAADILNKIPGAPLIFVLSSTYKKKYVKLLQSVYAERNPNKKFQGIIAPNGMRKDQLTTKTLVCKMKNSLTPYQMLEILLEWEAVLDKAKDETVETLFRVESTNVLRQLIKDIDRESGRSSLGREFTALCTRVLTRFTKSGVSFKLLSKKLATMASDSSAIPASAEETLTSLMMHYDPKGEDHLTGDIYKTKEQGAKEFAIVINPVCDFAQGNVHHLTVCYGFEISPTRLDELSNPIYHVDPDLIGILSGNRDKEQDKRKPASELRKLRKLNAVKEAKGKYLKPKTKISPRFHILRHVTIVRGRKSKKVQICFDFQNLESRQEVFSLGSKLDPWKRISRLDVPYVDAMLQDFGRYVSRMGVLAVNTPDA
jgi:hypothetical protein